jgi:hypothetical protein
MRTFPVSAEVSAEAISTAAILQQRLDHFTALPPGNEAEHYLNNELRPTLLEFIGFVYAVADAGLEAVANAAHQALATILPTQDERETYVAKLPPIVELSERRSRIRSRISIREFSTDVTRDALEILNGAAQRS